MYLHYLIRLGNFVALSKRHKSNSAYLSLYYSGLMSWVKVKDEELLRVEAVAGIPDRVAAQITEVEVHIHLSFLYALVVCVSLCQ